MKDSQKSVKKKRFFKKKNPKVLKSEGIIFVGKVKEKQKTPSILRNYANSFQLILIPLIFLAVLLIIRQLNINIAENVRTYKLSATSAIHLSPYPIVDNPFLYDLTSKAAIALDSDSQTVLFSKNPQLRFSMASTVKIMTALVGLEYYQHSSILTIRSGFVAGSGINLQKGDSFTFSDLMHAMLLPSANDAAAAIADNYPGGRSAFVAAMNKKAGQFHLADTHFADPIGLDDDGNYTTVVDLARLGSIAMKNSEFAKVVSTQQKFIYNTSNLHEYNLQNLNRLLGINGVNGIKTGTTEGAGEVLVTSAIQNGHPYVIVVMNSQDRFLDTQYLLSFLSENIKYIDPSSSKNP